MRAVLLGRRVLGAAVLGVSLLLAGRVLLPLPELTRARLAVEVLLLVAVLALGVLDSTELLAGTVSLADGVVCARPVLRLLRRLTVLTDAGLAGTGLAGPDWPAPDWRAAPFCWPTPNWPAAWLSGGLGCRACPNWSSGTCWPALLRP